MSLGWLGNNFCYVIFQKGEGSMKADAYFCMQTTF